MNRRTFLKTVGAVVAVVSVPVVSAIAKPEPKWTKFSEAYPKVGQKVIVASKISTLGSIFGGVVDKVRNSYDGRFVSLSTTDDFYVGYSSDSYVVGISYSEEGKEVISTSDWIREKENIYPRDYIKFGVTDHECDYHKETYMWLPVNGEYPKIVPPIPFNPVYVELEKE